MANGDFEITPQELATLIESGERPFLLDVRNDYETEIANLPVYDRLIPVDVLERYINELDQNQDIVIYCRSGARSGRAVDMLKAHGFTRVKNLVGGVLRWSDDVDPTVAKY